MKEFDKLCGESGETEESRYGLGLACGHFDRTLSSRFLLAAQTWSHHITLGVRFRSGQLSITFVVVLVTRTEHLTAVRDLVT